MEKNPVIELRNVAVFHSAKPGSSNPKKRGEMVVSGVNLTVCEGEMVYFIGKVGSGRRFTPRYRSSRARGAS